MKAAVIITAGGAGSRMGRPKQFLDLNGKPMIEWTIDAFKRARTINEIILVVSEADFDKAKKYGLKTAKGGDQRTDSVRNGLAMVSPDTDVVLVHDGARPLITTEIINLAVLEAEKNGAVVVCVSVKDTIKEVDNFKNSVVKTLDRKTLYQAQTPQAFKYEIIKKAYEHAKSSATDDSKLVEDLGVTVKVIMGSYENIKITTPEDLLIAESILTRRTHGT